MIQKDLQDLESHANIAKDPQAKLNGVFDMIWLSSVLDCMVCN